jgi:CO/xanthine dehydrogenase Mo-binding subunit
MTKSRVRHAEWEDRTSGRTLYVGDLPMSGVLSAALLRSPHRRARILKIDTSAAEVCPGVHAVITAADLPDRHYTDNGTSDRPALARCEVRYVGHEIAAVAADSQEQARAAIERIRVSYEPLPPFPSFESQLRSGPSGGDECIAGSFDRLFGDERCFDTEPAIHVAGEYRFGSQAHACMEPHAALASWNVENNVLDLWAPTQGTRNVQREVALMLGLDADQVRVHRIAAGGDFGSRVRPGDIEVVTAALALKTQRTVRLMLTRDEEFAHTKRRHDFVVRLSTGARADGRLLTRTAEILVESGGFAQASVSEMGYSSQLLASQYRVDAARIQGTAFYTHRRPGGSFRGAGGPQAAFALEVQMDELAERLSIDPVDLRIRNAHQPGETTASGWQIESSRLTECLQTARAAVDWDQRRALAGSGHGIGIAAGTHVSGVLTNPHATTASAIIDLGTDGSIVVRTGAGDPGTGQPMVAAILVAEEFGVDPDAVAIVYQDTADTPYDPGAGASKGTFMTGSAALGAGRLASARVRELAAAKFAVPADQVTLADGRVTAGSDTMLLGDLVASVPEAANGILRIQYRHDLELPLLTGPSGFGNLSPSYGFAAHAVELDVDRSTGRIRVHRVHAVHDSGTIINPIGARGQVVGGVVMALGAALGEELVYVEDQLANGSYTEYAVPRAADAPEVVPIFLESDTGPGPQGAKGLAEVALAPVAAAVVNAVHHAVGVRITDLPITPDKVLAALEVADQHQIPLHGRRSTWRRIDPHRWWIHLMRWAYPHGLHAVLHRYGTRLARRRRTAARLKLIPADTGQQAARLLAQIPMSRPLGGGSDLIVARQQGLRGEENLVDLTGIDELTVLESTHEGDLRIGGAATLEDLGRFAAAHGDTAIASAIDTIATPQIRSVATVAGNLCQEKRCSYFRNGYPCYKRGGASCPCYAVLGDHRFYHAALGGHRCQATTPSDLATVFAALDAVAVLQGPTAQRRISIQDLYRGPGETTLRNGELIAEIVIPAQARRRTTAFEKLGLYDGGFAMVAACASLEVDDDGAITTCRAVLGGLASKPYRVTDTERRLIGQVPTASLIDQASASWTPHADPLPGTRWKLRAGSNLLARALRSAADQRAPRTTPGHAQSSR